MGETMNKNWARVLCVGNCSFDHQNITRVLVEHFEADVHSAATADLAIQAVRDGRFDLILINRVFDADGDSGLELIKRLQKNEGARSTPVMLVSNYTDAQTAAVNLGAKPGFGKSDLLSPETRERVATVLHQNAAPKTGLK